MTGWTAYRQASYVSRHAHAPLHAMRRVRSLQDLTAADWALHERELAVLRVHLFRNHSPQSLHITGELGPIPPCVIVIWYPAPARRALQRGGIRYQVHFPSGYGRCEFGIQHWDEDRYWLTAGYLDCRGAAFTRFSLTRSFHELAECFVECIRSMERELTNSSSAQRTMRKSPTAPRDQ